ncbi:MAG: N-acetyl-gamma-glutamyl-phosphate reductase [Micrococcales bacterium]|nr:N-acetyl-gamma-glutamyl-phosphate reductase [Micrococcales bacterium]
MVFSVAVAGASGYAGGEVLRLLVDHPQVQVKTVTANASAGDALVTHHPHLAGSKLAGLTLQASTPELLAGHDVVVVGLPHGASGELTDALVKADPDLLVLDLGADHRLVDPEDWREYYGGEAAAPWTYGLPELLTGWGQGTSQALPKRRAALKATKTIAVPGCNATAVTLALAPGLAAGTLAADDLVAVLACGPSGAGKAHKPHLMASEIMGSASPYAVGGTHRHIPEIVQNLSFAADGVVAGSVQKLNLAGQGEQTGSVPKLNLAAKGAVRPTLSFTPTLVPMSRGILATVTAKPGPNFDPEKLREPWQRAYGDEPFIQLLPIGTWPTTAQTLGANTAAIQLAFDQKADRIVLVCALDNLVKGTAGAAIQSMNLALGLPETTGLPTCGVAP